MEDPLSDWHNVIGATIVFAPGIGVGRNNFLSWGYTTDKADTQDLFQMINNEDNSTYYYKGVNTPYTITQTKITVKGYSDPVIVDLYFSVYGPTLPNANGNWYSLAWAALGDVDTSFEALMDSNTASSLSEWRTAMSKWVGLTFNGVYGDQQGNIAVQVTGRFPERVAGDFGDVPKPGNGNFDWLG